MRHSARFRPYEGHQRLSRRLWPRARTRDASGRGEQCHHQGPRHAGLRAVRPVIVQGHMDMVCAKAPDCAKDMEREGLELAVEGDTVLARGTSLGGDDGIAVAMALALLDAKDLPHPPIEAVFTVDEEIGLLGAAALDVSPARAAAHQHRLRGGGRVHRRLRGRRNGALRAARHAHGLRRSRHDRHGQRPARRALRLRRSTRAEATRASCSGGFSTARATSVSSVPTAACSTTPSCAR